MGADLAGLIRDIPDFPKPGILFKDITPLLADPAGLDAAVRGLADWARDRAASTSSSAPRRAASCSARRWRASSAPASSWRASRASCPTTTVRAEYVLEYGTDALELHADAIDGGTRVLVHDDLLATGGTARALVELVEQLGGEVVGCGVPARARLPGRPRRGSASTRSTPARLRRQDCSASARAEGPPQPHARRPARRGLGHRRRPDPPRALVAEGRARRGSRRRRLHPGADDRPRARGARRLPRRSSATRARSCAGARRSRARRSTASCGRPRRRCASSPRATGRGSALELRQRLRGVAALGGFIVRRATRRIVDEALDGLEEVHGTAWPLSRCAGGAGARTPPRPGTSAARRTRPPGCAERLGGPLGPRRGRRGARGRAPAGVGAGRRRAPRAGGGGGRGRRPHRPRPRACSTPPGKAYPDLVRLRAGEPDGAPDAVVLPADHGQVRRRARGLRARGRRRRAVRRRDERRRRRRPRARRLRGRRGPRPRAAGRRRGRRRASRAWRGSAPGLRGRRARARCSAPAGYRSGTSRRASST